MITTGHDMAVAFERQVTSGMDTTDLDPAMHAIVSVTPIGSRRHNGTANCCQPKKADKGPSSARMVV